MHGESCVLRLLSFALAWNQSPRLLSSPSLASLSYFHSDRTDFQLGRSHPYDRLDFPASLAPRCSRRPKFWLLGFEEEVICSAFRSRPSRGRACGQRNHWGWWGDKRGGWVSEPLLEERFQHCLHWCMSETNSVLCKSLGCVCLC